MSSQDGPDAAEIIALYGAKYKSRRQVIYLPAPPANTELTTPPVAASFTALLLYEYLVTVDQEVRLFWTRPARAASLLFFVIRYWTLLNYVVFWAMSVAAAGFSDKAWMRISPSGSCALGSKIQFAFVSLQYIPWAVLSALRVFALSGMNRPLSAFVFLLASVPAVTNMVAFKFGLTGAKVLTLGCIEQLDVTPLQHEILSVVTRASLTAADVIVVVVTIFATWSRGLPRVCTGACGRASLGDVLLYNDAVLDAYADSASDLLHSILLALNILVIVLSRASSDAIVQQASYLTNISAPLSAILICRFLLDLQAANRAAAEFGSHMLSLPSGLRGDGDASEDTLRFDVAVFGAETRHDSLFTGYWDGASMAAFTEESDDTDTAGDAGHAMVLRPVTSAEDRSGSESHSGMGGLG
ncbi:hypothetical protein TRAPUB_14295 [Trametes pubescens]|uniref:DUF6533 domain-containing protein n=1 Tax=Trametes pubescens TaxID=154538 RepID=A0A1M2VNU5_TRAPU|nr:hypothetical protein TRAPUB_14295 [Trametes pubescens]